jgi:hypothetical protein
MAVDYHPVPCMTTRSKKALANKISHSSSAHSIRRLLEQAPMAGEHHVWGAAGAAHCPNCEERWKRALSSLQATLPAQHFETISRTFRDVWQADRGFVEDSRVARGQQHFEIVLSHDCASVACTDPNCGLCCNSTSRRCSDLLLPKYLVRDPLVPACGAPAAVKIKRRNADGTSSETLAESDFKQLPAFVLQVHSFSFLLP